jgi:hypothetical protein
MLQAYRVSIRQHTYVGIRPIAYVRQHTYVGIRQHTSVYVVLRLILFIMNR